MHSKNTLLILALGIFTSLPGFSAESRDPAKPNIVLILADDLGYGDTSCYGAELINTPNIDNLASQGIRLTDAHAAASLCSPSRYSLLNGYSSWRLHKKGNGYRLSPERETIASFLKKHGYATAAIGKWHLGYSKDWNKLPITGPNEVGFTYNFTVPSNHNDNTRAFIENHDIVGREPGVDYKIVDDKDFPEGLAQPRVDDQVDTVLTEKAVAFIRRNADQPFFLYLASCIPHTHTTPAARFRGTSKAGLLGDHVQELDHHVGTILNTLDELNLADNTLVIFTSDNGGSPKDFRGTANVKLNLADDSGDIRKKFKSAKTDARKMGHLTNGIYQDGKGHPYEGGHRIPFIARWPGKINPGSNSAYTCDLTDLFATFAAAIDAPLPHDAAEDSINLLPVLLENKDPENPFDEVFIQGDGKAESIAVCSGTWKLIVRKKNGKTSYELYDLTKDPGETDNLAKANPEVTERLANALIKAESSGRTRP
ncbi:MAG: sulfatase family protein [Verrucomicrobiales bacterium]|nr:arylsulfatase [Verrucomicrobiota bacterium JB025]